AVFVAFGGGVETSRCRADHWLGRVLDRDPLYEGIARVAATIGEVPGSDLDVSVGAGGIGRGHVADQVHGGIGRAVIGGSGRQGLSSGQGAAVIALEYGIETAR